MHNSVLFPLPGLLPTGETEAATSEVQLWTLLMAQDEVKAFVPPPPPLPSSKLRRSTLLPQERGCDVGAKAPSLSLPPCLWFVCAARLTKRNSAVQLLLKHAKCNNKYVYRETNN